MKQCVYSMLNAILEVGCTTILVPSNKPESSLRWTFDFLYYWKNVLEMSALGRSFVWVLKQQKTVIDVYAENAHQVDLLHKTEILSSAIHP